MQLDLEGFLLVLFLGAAMVTALIVGVLLILRSKGNKLSNKLLGSYLVLSALTMLGDFLGSSGIANHYPYLYFIPLVFSFAFGPLFYLFVKTKINNIHQLKGVDYLHFILPLAQFTFYILIGFRSIKFKGWFWEQVYGPYLQYAEEGLFPILSLVYIYAAYRLGEKKVGKKWEEKTYRWIRRFALVFGLLITVVAFYTMLEWIMWLGFDVNIYNVPYLIIPLQLSTFLTVFWVTVNAWLYSHQSFIFKRVDSKGLLRQAIGEKVSYQFEKEKIYLNQDLDLNLLAALTNVSRNKLSAFFSSNGVGFNDYVNNYRVAAFKEKVTMVNAVSLSVEGLAYEVGFNSRSTFYRAFKKRYEISPAQFIKNLET